MPVMAQMAQTSASQKVIRLVANDQDILRLPQVPQRVAISADSVADVQILFSAFGQWGEVLQEVRICFSKDMRSFQSCAEVDRRGCRARQITVPPTR